MTDQIGRPILLTHFPRCVCSLPLYPMSVEQLSMSAHREIKAFYMKRCPGDEEFTESVDVVRLIFFPFRKGRLCRRCCTAHAQRRRDCRCVR